MIGLIDVLRSFTDLQSVPVGIGTAFVSTIYGLGLANLLLLPLAHEHGLDLSVLHREATDRTGGLSTAVLAGVKAARGEFVGIMDADLQHDVTKVPDLLAALDAILA